MSSPAKSLKSPMKSGKEAMSPYGKMGSPVHSLEGTAPTKKRDASPGKKAQWTGVSLPEIPGVQTDGPASGPLTPKDVEEDVLKERKAFEFWMQSAENGDAEAQNSLGVCFFHGRGVEKNVQKAVQWWTKAADQQHLEGMYNLGICLYHGRGVPKDQVFAVSMFAQAAEKNHPESVHMLGVCFQLGAGVGKDKDKALELFRKGAALGVEESHTKVLVMQDRFVRENEISQLGDRIERIKDGFIQLQLERTATEEVTHAYKGAGFFLSNVKSETPIRARIDQAKAAEKEIKALRHDVAIREKERQELLSGSEDKTAEIERLLDQVHNLTKENDAQKAEIKMLEKAKLELEAEGQKQREHVKELLSENIEMRTVAEWAKNQRVDVLKQSLAAVVKTTMKEGNEREKKLRHEIEQLRLRLGRNAGGVQTEMDAGDHAALFMKQTRRDMFLQEALLRHVIEGVRDDDFAERVYNIKSLNDDAESLEKIAFTCVEKLLDHLDTASSLSDDQSLALRESLNRIQGSMSVTLSEAKEAYTINHVKINALLDENNKLRDDLNGMKKQLEELRSINEAQRTSAMKMETNASEIESAMRKMERKTTQMGKQAKDNEERLAKEVQAGKLDPRIVKDVKKIYGELHTLKEEIAETAVARQQMEVAIATSYSQFEEFAKLENDIITRMESVHRRASITDEGDGGAAAAAQHGSPGRSTSPVHQSFSPMSTRGAGMMGMQRDGTLSSDSLAQIQEMHDELAYRLEDLMGFGAEGTPIRDTVEHLSKNMNQLLKYMGISEGILTPSRTPPLEGIARPPPRGTPGSSRPATPSEAGFTPSVGFVDTEHRPFSRPADVPEDRPRSVAPDDVLMIDSSRGQREEEVSRGGEQGEGSQAGAPSDAAPDEGGEAESHPPSSHKSSKPQTAVEQSGGQEQEPPSSAASDLEAHSQGADQEVHSEGGSRPGSREADRGARTPAPSTRQASKPAANTRPGSRGAAPTTALPPTRRGSTNGQPEPRKPMGGLAADIAMAVSQDQEKRFKDLERTLYSRLDDLKRAVTPSTPIGDMVPAERVQRIRAEYSEKELQLKAALTEAKSEVKELHMQIKILELEKEQIEAAKLKSEEDLVKHEFEAEQKLEQDKWVLNQEIKKLNKEIENLNNEKNADFAPQLAAIKQKEDELEAKREVYMEAQIEYQTKSMATMKETMERFGPQVAIHLSDTFENLMGGGMVGGRIASSGMNGEVLDYVENLSKTVQGNHTRVLEEMEEMGKQLKGIGRKLGKAALPGGGVQAATSPTKAAGPVHETPLPADAMDLIKQDLHFAVASAVRNVLDKHPGGVVLLNVPDHNKPAGFFNGDGAGFLHQSVQEQRNLNSKLVGDVDALRSQISQLEQTLARTHSMSSQSSLREDGQLETTPRSQSSHPRLQDGFAFSPDVLPMHALTPSKKASSGGITTQQRHELETEVNDMKELLQSWYRSFAYISKLERSMN